MVTICVMEKKEYYNGQNKENKFDFIVTVKDDEYNIYDLNPLSDFDFDEMIF